MKHFISSINSIFIGAVFLLSGILKAIDSATFADLLSQYGFVWFGYAAPVIILCEIAIGMTLLFRVYVRPITWITLGFIIGVTAIFAYGLLFRNITNCGCFGSLAILNHYPWLTFSRNAVILVLLVWSLFYPPQQNNLSNSTISFFAIIMCIAAYLCGFSLHGSQILKEKQNLEYFQPQSYEGSSLQTLLSTETSQTLFSDSSYLVFAFSYTCPYCQNSIGNIHQYISMKAADRVIGLAIDDTIGRDRFYRLFEPKFEIKQIPRLSMTRLTSTLPTTFYIRHDSIVSQYNGMAFSPAFLMP